MKGPQIFLIYALLVCYVPFAEAQQLFDKQVRAEKSTTALIYLLDSSATYIFDTSQVNWEPLPSMKNIILGYDSNYQKLLEYSKGWNGSTFDYRYQYSYAYDSIGQLQQVTGFLHNGNSWDMQTRNNFEYDSLGNILAKIERTWTHTTWTNTYKYTWRFDSANKLTCVSFFHWNQSYWRIASRDTNTYDAQHRLLTHLSEHWNGTSWNNEIKEFFSYNASQQLSTKIVQEWNGTVWENKLKHVYTYDANGNLLTDLALIFYSFTNWGNYWKDSYTYNTSNQQLTHLFQLWDTNHWQFAVQEQNRYTAASLLQSYCHKSGNGQSNVITDGDSTVYYYHAVITGLAQESKPATLFFIAPNPAQEYSIIYYKVAEKNLLLRIRNLQGEEVFSAFLNTENHAFSFSTHGFSAGYYVCSLSKDGIVLATKKLVILK